MSLRSRSVGSIVAALMLAACSGDSSDGDRAGSHGGAGSGAGAGAAASSGGGGSSGRGGSGGRPSTSGAGGNAVASDGGVTACTFDGECGAGHRCNPDSGRCELGQGCGQSQFEISALPPNMLILLDRSGSMDGDADGDTRWNVAKQAINAVTSDYDDKARFGLATYSACLAGGCSAGTVVVPIEESNADAVQAFLDNTLDERSDDGQETDDDGHIRYLCDSGDPETSTGASLAALVGEASLLDPTRTNAVVLLTDGEENEECADDCDGPCGAEALLEQSPSVKTYVIGLGVNADAIDAIAEAGDTEHAIEATNQAELSDAFDQVAAAVASCDYELDEMPPDPDELYVFFDDDPAGIPSDDTDGFSFDAASLRLRFYGSACEAVKSGQVTDIDVVYGCPLPVVD
jgi:hypothetical protein